MAYQCLTSPASDISGDTSALLNGSSYATLAYWTYRSATGKVVDVGYTVTNQYFILEWYSDNIIYSGPAAGSNTYISSQNQKSKTGWCHLAVVFDGTKSTDQTKAKCYFNGVDQVGTGNDWVGPLPSSLSSSLGAFRVGNSISNCIVADVGVWNVALTADEIASLAKGFSPQRIRPQNLQSNLRLVRDVIDAKSGIAFTNSNATVADHPRVY